MYAGPDRKRHHHDEESLEPFRASFNDVLREGLRTDGLKAPAVTGSVALVEIPGYWSKGEIEYVVQGMNDTLLNDAAVETR